MQNQIELILAAAVLGWNLVNCRRGVSEPKPAAWSDLGGVPHAWRRNGTALPLTNGVLTCFGGAFLLCAGLGDSTHLLIHDLFMSLLLHSLLYPRQVTFLHRDMHRRLKPSAGRESNILAQAWPEILDCAWLSLECTVTSTL